MSADTGVESAAPNLNLTSEEKRFFGQLFRQADTDSVGVVTGEIAVKFFEKTRLDSRILGEIWQIADSENRGFLTPAGFSIVLRLIGHAQAGREPTAEIAAQPGPIPQFDGFQPAALASPQAPSASPLQSQGTGGPVRIPPLTPEKATKYASLFDQQTLKPGGLLPGDQAKQIFEKSGLPNEALGRIWQLADTEQRGALVQTEFVIAMHLLSSMKSGALRGLPNILPAPLYEAATRRGSASRQSPTNTGAMSAIPRQLSGTAPMRVGSPLSQPHVTGSNSEWLVTPSDKARFDQLYDDLDKSRKGFITGEEAVPFLSQSNLAEDALAQIWDLADVNSEGRLNRDTFAVVMYLIRQQRTRRDGSTTLPTSLPANLIPPSMRQGPQLQATENSPFDAPGSAPISSQQGSAQPVAAPPASKSALDDLFDLDSSSSATAAAPPAQKAQITGGSAAHDPFNTSTGLHSPASPSKPSSPVPTQFKPFVPSSSFGRGLTAQATGDSTGSGAGAVKMPAPTNTSDDLLGDNDPEVSKKLTNETTELANLSNQVSSLSKQMQEVQGQRNTTQNELNQASAQKQNFEQRLAQLRTLYEKEAGDLQSLRDQLNTARKETQKLQAECMQLDTTYRDMQTQRQQVQAGLDTDKQENGNLKDKIRAVNSEIAKIKPHIEKLKSEARQQKGLVAINKKQLVTNEGERDKLQSEAADLAKGKTEAIARQDTGSSMPGSAPVASPAASVASGNNPFFKRTGSTDIMGAFASPGVKPQGPDQSFDDIFGPSNSGGSTGSPLPHAVSFKPQNTGTSTGSVGSFSTPPTTSPAVSRQATLATDAAAPSDSRQASSGFLPFADASESLSSSRGASPPASRLDEAADSASTPTQAPTAHPGAFPLEPNFTGEASTKEGASQGNSHAGFTGETSAASHLAKTPDPFGAMDQDRAKADFENAFATFSKAHKAGDQLSAEKSKPASTFDSEFPPISELERDDDDSDTASERGGFDDDFAPASPPGRQQPHGATGSGDPKGASAAALSGIAFESAEQSGIAAPDVTATSPTAGQTQNDGLSNSQVNPNVTAAPPPAPPTSQTLTNKGAFDDLDDDFEGLEDAKEGSADDDFQTISRSGLDDFNPVFDSSPPKSQTKGDPPATASFGQESSYDFGATSTNSAASNGPNIPENESSQKGAASTESHDWDAIFATLDAPSEPAASTTIAGPGIDKEHSKQTPGGGTAEEGKDDDPILKDLTSMGYSRADALLALEKYDYNLERAANHLASQS